MTLWTFGLPVFKFLNFIRYFGGVLIILFLKNLIYKNKFYCFFPSSLIFDNCPRQTDSSETIVRFAVLRIVLNWLNQKNPRMRERVNRTDSHSPVDRVSHR